MNDLVEMISRQGIKLQDIEEYLDSLSVEDRIKQVVSLGKKDQILLWHMAEGSRPFDLTYLVPENANPLDVFPFEGKNSLPVFRRFKKVFYRDSEGNVCGYNANPLLVRLTIGHGYFVVGTNPHAPGLEIQIDYTRVPKEKPPGWPQVKSNDVFPTMFVYGGTKDNLRLVSKDVVIGRAYKQGKDPMPNWFALCRETPK